MKYRKRPVVIEALQWTGQNVEAMALFMGGGLRFRGKYLMIPTPEGEMRASVGDYIIRGVRGEYYPCNGDIFLQTYEPVEGEQ